MSDRRIPHWQYVTGWSVCAHCGCLRPDRELVRARRLDGTPIVRCRDGAWCARTAAERFAGKATEEEPS